MKYTLTLISIVVIGIILLVFIIPLENQLSDCYLECNHLQAKLWRLEELNDYIPAMENILNPLQLAELKALSEQIKQKKYRNYEAIELPLLNEKELKQLRK